MTDNTATHLILSLWYNRPAAGPAIPGRPDLGEMPHAQAAMKALGITYRRAFPRPVVDDWCFCFCENVPAELPKWLTRASPEELAYLLYPLPGGPQE